MQLSLLTGRFDTADARQLLQQLYQVKIRFHEQKINPDAGEESIKMREMRIKVLQQQLKDAMHYLDSCGTWVNMESGISLDTEK